MCNKTVCTAVRAGSFPGLGDIKGFEKMRLRSLEPLKQRNMSPQFKGPSSLELGLRAPRTERNHFLNLS